MLRQISEVSSHYSDAVDKLVAESWDLKVPLKPKSPESPKSPTSPTTPRTKKIQAFEAINKKALEATGRTLDKLCLHHLTAAPEVKKDVASLRLNECFDDRGGSLRFRRLGLAFTVKQHPSVPSEFGSQGIKPDNGGRTTATCSAKAFFLSTMAKERDLEYGKKQIAEVCQSLTVSERHKVQDVLDRQIEVVFAEVPSFKDHLPPGVQHSDLLPLDIDRDEEMRARRSAERGNLNLADRSWEAGAAMCWFFTKAEVKVLLQVVGLWMRATRGPATKIGMDRPSFCRLILDLGLVDQDKVSYSWAVSLFDTVAKPMHINAADGSISQSQPVVPIVSHWDLVHVLDFIIRRNFDATTKQYFMLSLFNIARYRLPAFVIQDSGLEADKLIDAMNDKQQEVPLSPSQTARSSDADSADGPEMQVFQREPFKNQEQEEQMMDQLTHSMLVEPEVLHLVTQFQGIFQQFHACYSDASGDMVFQKFQQFCVDFHLTPALVSSHFLKNTYTGAQCVEMPCHHWVKRQKPQRASRRMKKETKEKCRGALLHSLRTGDLTKAVQSLEREEEEDLKKAMRRQKTGPYISGQELKPPASGPQPWLSIARRAAALVAKKAAAPGSEANSAVVFHGGARRTITEAKLKAEPSLRIALTAAPSAEDDSIREPSRPTSRESTRSARSTRSTRSTSRPPRYKSTTKLGLGGSGRRKSAGRATSSTPFHPPKPPPEPEPVEPRVKFGAGAFVECLCRIAFSYLGTYGNYNQQQASGYVRVTWLMTYLHCVFTHLKESFGKRSPEEVHTSLAKALQSINSKVFAIPPLPTKGILPPMRMCNGLPGKAEVEQRKKAHLIAKVARVVKRISDATPRGSKRRNSSKDKLKNTPGEPAEEQRQPSKQKPSEIDEVAKRSFCVVDGSCRVCAGKVSGKWGNPRCHGCSIVGRQSLEHHLFKQLLLDGPDIKRPMAPKAEWPCKTTRPVLTPPPMRGCHSHRGGSFPERAVKRRSRWSATVPETSNAV